MGAAGEPAAGREDVRAGGLAEPALRTRSGHTHPLYGQLDLSIQIYLALNFVRRLSP